LINKGILIENSDTKFEISDISIKNYRDYGLKLVNVKNGLIRNFQVSWGLIIASGIYLLNSENIIIESGEINRNNGDGLILRRSNNNTIKDLSINQNDNGIFLFKSDSNLLIDNFIHYNSKNGIYFSDSKNNQIIDCEINHNLHSGIYMYYRSSGNLIINNEIFDNSYIPQYKSYPAIYIRYYSNNVKILDNDISNHNNWGVDVYSSDNIEICNNNIHFNTGGIQLYTDIN
ncbi:unnamed protein product, partial [marine sediment metagenome]